MAEALVAPLVSAVLVNWRRPDLTVQAVALLRKQSHPLKIIVVDNGSSDGSVAYLSEHLHDVELICRATNGGFGAGCNAALSRALGDGCRYVWLINNDATPASDALDHLVRKAESDTMLGIVGSNIVTGDPLEPPHAGSVMNPWTLGSKLTSNQCELNGAPYSWVTAASALIRCDALRHVGVFDERFFMYWEDADLSMRFKKGGYRLGVAENAVVVHEAGTSSKGSERLRYKWHFQSQLLWIEKHLSCYPIFKILLCGRFLLKALLDRDLKRVWLLAQPQRTNSTV